MRWGERRGAATRRRGDASGSRAPTSPPALSLALAAVATSALALAGCSNSWDLPDPSDGVVQEQQAGLSPVVARALGHETCRLRMLGSQGERSYFWADCQGPEESGSSLPIVIENGAVTTPEDGAAYTASIERMFPRALARRILDHDPVLRP